MSVDNTALTKAQQRVTSLRKRYRSLCEERDKYCLKMALEGYDAVYHRTWFNSPQIRLTRGALLATMAELKSLRAVQR